MEEAPENGKESPHSVQANGLIVPQYMPKSNVFMFVMFLLCMSLIHLPKII